MIGTHKNGITLTVHLTPNASKNALVRTDSDAAGKKRLRISVTAIPENGKANAALIKLLAKTFSLPKTSLSLIAGEQSRTKVIFIKDETETLASQIREKLEPYTT